MNLIKAATVLSLFCLDLSAADLTPYKDFLKSPDRDVRLSGIFILSKLGPESKDAAPAITNLFNDGDAIVRVEAAYALVPILGPQESLKTYEHLATNTTLRIPVRNVGTIGARKAGKPAVPLLRALLKDSEPAVRARALESLRYLHENKTDVKDLEPEVIKLVGDKDPQVKKAALNLVETLATTPAK